MAGARRIVPFLFATTAALATAQAQEPAPAKNLTVDTHLAAAKQAAGFDYTGMLARTASPRRLRRAAIARRAPRRRARRGSPSRPRCSTTFILSAAGCTPLGR